MFVSYRIPNPRGLAVVAWMALNAGCGGAGSNPAALPPGVTVDALATATPIKHVIIIVGENRSFDHIFATYVAKRPGESVWNLLSQKIIDSDGMPGPNFAMAHQYRVN